MDDFKLWDQLMTDRKFSDVFISPTTSFFPYTAACFLLWFSFSWVGYTFLSEINFITLLSSWKIEFKMFFNFNNIYSYFDALFLQFLQIGSFLLLLLVGFLFFQSGLFDLFFKFFNLVLAPFQFFALDFVVLFAHLHQMVDVVLDFGFIQI